MGIIVGAECTAIRLLICIVLFVWLFGVFFFFYRVYVVCVNLFSSYDIHFLSTEFNFFIDMIMM